MKTKDFIAMLQKADPTGEGHLRMSGGVPTCAVDKPGYYDGPYEYIDDEGNFVISAAGYKVDIYTTDLEDFVYENTDEHDPDSWEKIKAKLKFEFGVYAYPEQRQEKIDGYLKAAAEYYQTYLGMKIDMYERAKQEMIKNAYSGWSWFQNKLVDTEGKMHHYYTWKIFNENGKGEGSNLHNTESVQKSGLWERCDNGVMEGYFQWVFKGLENQVPNMGKPSEKKKRSLFGFLK